jgi:hypothetical protein
LRPRRERFVLHHLGSGNAPFNLFGDAASVTQTITPWLSLVGIVLGGVVLGLFNAHNRKRGNVEQRAPDVNESWAEARAASHELDMERKLRRRFQNWAWELRAAFRSYVIRVQNGGSTEMTAYEQMFFDSDPPTEEVPKQNP